MPDNYDPNAALHYAAIRGDIQGAAAAISLGADVNCWGVLRDTVTHNRREMLRFLYSKGVTTSDVVYLRRYARNDEMLRVINSHDWFD